MAKALPSFCSCSIAWPWALGKDRTSSDIEVLLCDYFPLSLVCCKPFLAYHIIYTQIHLGDLWNCLFIPPNVCILAWLIFYLKIPTEICYSLFTTGSKSDNRLHSRLYACRGGNQCPCPPKQHRFRKFSTLPMVHGFPEETDACSQFKLFCGTIYWSKRKTALLKKLIHRQ